MTNKEIAEKVWLERRGIHQTTAHDHEIAAAVACMEIATQNERRACAALVEIEAQIGSGVACDLLEAIKAREV